MCVFFSNIINILLRLLLFSLFSKSHHIVDEFLILDNFLNKKIDNFLSIIIKILSGFYTKNSTNLGFI